MLCLLFDLNADRYALDCRHVVEVVPVVRIKQIPMAPRGIAGVISYRGRPAPVIDLTALTLDRPSRNSLSTRLIIVEHRADSGVRLLALIAEHATEIVRRSETDFIPPRVRLDEAPFLGSVATDTRGMVQLIDPARLVPQNILDRLTVSAES